MYPNMPGCTKLAQWDPGTYTLYYLMASDVGGGGSGSYSSLADELGDIKDTIGDIATILASI